MDESSNELCKKTQNSFFFLCYACQVIYFDRRQTLKFVSRSVVTVYFGHTSERLPAHRRWEYVHGAINTQYTIQINHTTNIIKR